LALFLLLQDKQYVLGERKNSAEQENETGFLKESVD